MAASTGTLYRYQDPVGLAIVPARLTASGRAAVALRADLARLGLDTDTVVTDIGDEVVGEHRVKLIGWLDRDGMPQVTSLCLRLFIENFRRVVPA